MKLVSPEIVFPALFSLAAFPVIIMIVPYSTKFRMFEFSNSTTLFSFGLFEHFIGIFNGLFPFKTLEGGAGRYCISN